MSLLLNQKAGRGSGINASSQFKRSAAAVQPGFGQEDQGNSRMYTPERRFKIFSTHPHVKRAYFNNVPDKMTEDQFWKLYMDREDLNVDLGHIVRRRKKTTQDIFDVAEAELKSLSEVRAKQLKDVPADVNLTLDTEAAETAGVHYSVQVDLHAAGRAMSHSAETLAQIRRFNLHFLSFYLFIYLFCSLSKETIS